MLEGVYKFHGVWLHCGVGYCRPAQHETFTIVTMGTELWEGSKRNPEGYHNKTEPSTQSAQLLYRLNKGVPPFGLRAGSRSMQRSMWRLLWWNFLRPVSTILNQKIAWRQIRGRASSCSYLILLIHIKSRKILLWGNQGLNKTESSPLWNFIALSEFYNSLSISTYP